MFPPITLCFQASSYTQLLGGTVAQRVKSLSTPSTSRLPQRCIVVSIGCIHASFRSRLMRDLNNIRVTARGRQRKKVKGHSRVSDRWEDRRQERVRETRLWPRRGMEEEEGEKEADELKNFCWSVSTVRFSMKPDRPRATFSFPLFRVSVTCACGMQPRERRPAGAVKKGFVHGRFFFFIIHIHKGWERYF